MNSTTTSCYDLARNYAAAHEAYHAEDTPETEKNVTRAADALLIALGFRGAYRINFADVPPEGIEAIDLEVTNSSDVLLASIVVYPDGSFYAR